MSNPSEPMLAHMVYFTLIDNSAAAIEKMISACREHLSNHPGTVLFAAGRLTEDLRRDVNDREFHVALQLVFENRAAHDTYQVSDRHQRFIAENKENWGKVRVFDADVCWPRSNSRSGALGCSAATLAYDRSVSA